ncbi:transmembrane protein 223-domain-containing protein [Dichotomocladium elegans]|nr:transmembrane protein 223-domain-containing protein [Dichotomocladium elegans]
MWILRPLLAQGRVSLLSVKRFASSNATAFDRKGLQQTGKHIRQALQGRDVVFYQAPDGVGRTFMFMYISAGVQLLFWGNLASLAYVTYSKKESDAEDAPVVLAPKSQRLAIAGGLVALGVGIASAMCMYPWRYIDKLILLRGGNRVKLVTHARFLDSHKYKEYPIDQMFCKQKVLTGLGPTGIDPLGKTNSSHIFLRAKGERMAYMLDRKGKFTDTKLFDGLWYNPSAR